jgi:hypothetical protein
MEMCPFESNKGRVKKERKFVRKKVSVEEAITFFLGGGGHVLRKDSTQQPIFIEIIIYKKGK